MSNGLTRKALLDCARQVDAEAGAQEKRGVFDQLSCDRLHRRARLVIRNFLDS